MEDKELDTSNPYSKARAIARQQKYLRYREVLLSKFSGKRKPLERSFDLQLPRSKTEHNPQKCMNLTEERLRQMEERRNNPEFVKEMKQKFISLYDPHQVERQEHVWESLCSKTYEELVQRHLPVQRQTRYPVCFICSLDEHPSSECPYKVEVPKNAIVGGGVEIVCKVCGGLFSGRCCNQESGRARLSRLMHG